MIAVSPSAHTLHLVERHFLHGVSYASAPVLALTSVVWWAAFAGAFAVVIAIGGWVRGAVIGVLLVALAAADLGHFLAGIQYALGDLPVNDAPSAKAGAEK